MPVRIISLLLIMFIASHSLADGDAKWESTGPYGGLIFSIQLDQSNSKHLVAWTTGGSFVSENAGESWKRIILPRGFEYNKHVKLIGSKFYCFRSDDIYQSEDGVKWKKEADLRYKIYDITCEPGKPENLNSIIAKREKGAFEYYMSCKEKEWQNTLMGTTPLVQPSWIYTLFSPSDTSIIRVFILFSEQKESTVIFGSDDGGKTWEQWTIDAKPANAVFSQKDKRKIYAACYKKPGKMSGLVKSTDAGKTWTQLSDDKRILNMRQIMIHPKLGNLYLGTNDKGLFMTKDEGKTLVELNNGFQNKSVSALACDPGNENVLYIGTQCGLYKSEDSGKRWKWMSEGIEGCQIQGMVDLGKESGKLIVFEHHQGMRISKDWGKTWSLPGDTNALPGKVFSVLKSDKDLLITARTDKSYGSFISNDEGSTWKKIEGLGEKDYLVKVISENEIYAVRDSSMIVKGGLEKPWKVLSKPFDNDTVRWIGKPEGKDYLIVIGDKEIIKISPETGKRAGSLEPPEGYVNFSMLYEPTFDPWKQDWLYVIHKGGDIFRYDIPNREWSKLYDHKAKGDNNWFGKVVFDPGRRGRLIAGYTDGFLAISEDHGKTWNKFNPELPFYAIKNMEATPDRKLVVTGSGTIYSFDLSKLDKE